MALLCIAYCALQEGDTAFTLAAVASHAAIVEFLISKSANINYARSTVSVGE
jgi:ankyrin repeat protein